MACLSDLSGCDLIFLANAVAIALSKDTDVDEITLWASFFTIVGDNLAAIAASKSLCDNDSSKK